ncbi:MAG TPA: hypothetical protein VGV64_02995 [Thermoplasmata archaeon]|nr:hypothetical protein [Thermoplasmata archaeon]
MPASGSLPSARAESGASGRPSAGRRASARDASPSLVSNRRRVGYALSAVLMAEVVGTIGFHVIEGASWINAFYFESMLATGQGPPFPLATDTGKVFASLMGFVSVGSVVSAIVLTIGPLAVQIWREGIDRFEREARRLTEEAEGGIRRFEEELEGKKGSG